MMIASLMIGTYSANEGGDEGDTSLGTGDSLTETEEEGKVTAISIRICLTLGDVYE